VLLFKCTKGIVANGAVCAERQQGVARPDHGACAQGVGLGRVRALARAGAA
jgi:hypothetical protein